MTAANALSSSVASSGGAGPHCGVRCALYRPVNPQSALMGEYFALHLAVFVARANAAGGAASNGKLLVGCDFKSTGSSEGQGGAAADKAEGDVVGGGMVDDKTLPLRAYLLRPGVLSGLVAGKGSSPFIIDSLLPLRVGDSVIA